MKIYQRTYLNRYEAFSLVESLIALALASVVIGSMWMLFSAGSRQGRKNSDKLDGLKGATTFVQIFEHDLKQIYFDESHSLEIFPHQEKRISFYVFSREKSDFTKNSIGTQRITYYLNNEKHAIYRQVGSENKKRLRGYYENLIIKLSLPDKRKIDFLITAVSPSFFKTPPEKRTAFERVVFHSSVVLWKKVDVDLNPHWNGTGFSSSEE